MRSMFGISLSHDADRLRPFRANVSWPFCRIGLHPILLYYTPSGLTQHSPERALYASDGFRPSDRKRATITSPERALYPSDGFRPSTERALYPSDGCRQSTCF